MAIREVSPRIWMKLAAIALSFTVPLILTTFFLVNEGNTKIYFAEQELRGDRYLRPLTRALTHIEMHRSEVRRGDLAQALETETLVDADFRDLLAVDGDVHDQLKTTATALNARGRSSAAASRLAESWAKVKAARDVAAGDELHDQLLGDIRTLITAVGDSSNLILDPDLDTYYIMDALLLQEPELIQGLSRLDGATAHVPAGDTALLRFHTDNLKTDLQTAFAETKNFNQSGALEPTLSPLLARALEATNAVADRAAASVDQPDYDVSVRKAIDAHAALWDGLFNQEDEMLRSRESGHLAGRRFQITAVGIALLLSLFLTLWVARRISRNVAAVAAAASLLAGGDLTSRAPVRSRDEVGVMANAFNTMAESLDALGNQMAAASLEVTSSATRLNSAADDLAATTVEQSASVTEASATTEKLARTSGSIADTVDGVAAQAAETRTNLQQAEGDIEASSVRTMALAERVNDIGAILTLINEIADQTNLLALNAAIEAARAGEAGRGFAVVAEEVRMLAERSKSSAADIGAIIKGIEAETTATVMAMEKGAKQMRASVTLLSMVTDGTESVRLTTQQQRSATSEVAHTMEQLGAGSRHVTETAGHIASASKALALLAANLEGTTATSEPSP